MKHLIRFMISLAFVLSIVSLRSNVTSVMRGGIEFTFANAQIDTLGSELYFSFDVQVAATGTGTRPRIGTGMVLINYNPVVFGTWVNSANSVIVTRGTLITTTPFQLYYIIVNDNQSGRLAVTYEYVSLAGWGSLMQFYPEELLNVKIKIINGGEVGLSFAQSPMTGQQYQDDNATFFSPVIAIDTENSVIPSYVPTNLSLQVENNTITLSWQGESGCTYSVFSASASESEIWQTEATGIAQTTWSSPVQDTERFYFVTSQSSVGRR
jgi:hypothetical protein